MSIQHAGSVEAPPMSVNITEAMDNSTGMVFHIVNVTTSDMSIVMELTPPSDVFEVRK